MSFNLRKVSGIILSSLSKSSIPNSSLRGVKHSNQWNTQNTVYFGIYTTQNRGFRTTAPLNSKKSPYEILEVSKNASKDEIKKAFFAKAKKYHPDVCQEPNAKELFAELNSAYQILKDDEKRKIYDMTGSSEAAEGQAGFDQGGHHHHHHHGMSPEDIFNEFFRGGENPFGGFNPFGDQFGGGFGRGSGVRAPQRGGTLQRRLSVPLQDVVYGATKQIRLQKPIPCEPCSGTGEDQQKQPTTCPTCNGSGTFRQSTGFMMFQTTCQTCHGTGQIRDRCKSCKGKGHNMEWKDVEIAIPPGILSGANLRVKGYGEPGVDGGPPGDMLLRIDVQNHPIFRRDRNDLEMDHEISVWTALLGGKEKIHTLNGEEVELIIPSGSQHDDKIPLRGHGIRPKNRTPGNLNVYIKVKIPRKLNEEQVKLVEQLANKDTN